MFASYAAVSEPISARLLLTHGKNATLSQAAICSSQKQASVYVKRPDVFHCAGCRRGVVPFSAFQGIRGCHAPAILSVRILCRARCCRALVGDGDPFRASWVRSSAGALMRHEVACMCADCVIMAILWAIMLVARSARLSGMLLRGSGTVLGVMRETRQES